MACVVHSRRGHAQVERGQRVDYMLGFEWTSWHVWYTATVGLLKGQGCLHLQACVARSCRPFQHSAPPAACTPSCSPALLPRSRRCKEFIAAAFDQSVDGGRASPLLNSRLHDFGFRWAGWYFRAVGSAHQESQPAHGRRTWGALLGDALSILNRAVQLLEPSLNPLFNPVSCLHHACPAQSHRHMLLMLMHCCHPWLASVECRGCTCVEQSVLGGVAHLLNFDGTGEGQQLFP